MKKTELHIDIETRSNVDLTKFGVYRYTEDPGFRILIMAFAYGDGPVEVIDFTQGESIPDQVLKDLVDPSVLKCAFNAQFERVSLNRVLGLNTTPWHCSMIQANALGLRGSLETVGLALNLPQEEQKLYTGKSLMRLFSIHRKPSTKNGMRTIYEPEDLPRDWELYKEYCKQDVEAERAVHKRLAFYPFPKEELALYQLDQKINDRGVRIDIDLASSATEINTELYAHYEEEFLDITGIDTPSQLSRFKAWIYDLTGENIESITKGNIVTLQKRFSSYPEIVKALEIRELLSRTSVKKYEMMDMLAGKDDRARGLFRFYGAATGRWSGRGIQPQNLPQNHLNDLDTARDIIRQRDLDSLEMFYDDPADVLSQCIRTAIIPSEGNLFLVADFSAIEARVIAWLAGEAWRLNVFRSHGKIYEASAAAMFNVPVDSIGRGDPLRQKGKIAELALGYQGSVGALRQMGALRMGLQESDLPVLVERWRIANPKIVRFWSDVEDLVVRCISSRKPQILNDRISCRYDRSILFIKLPSGRELAYPKAQLRPHQKFEGKTEITYQEISGKGWAVKGTYGGKLVENIVQATARDCLAEKMLELDRLGFDLVMHVHDEVVIEVDRKKAKEELPTVLSLMSEPVSWAPDLPLNADGFICEYYQKD